jgi:hypothetical protein
MRTLHRSFGPALSAVPLFAIMNCATTLAQDSVPLTNWPAPLYYQPSASDSAPASKGRDVREAAAQPHEATAPSGALVFVAMTPCRVVDTRAAVGFPAPFGGTGALTGGATPTNGRGRYPLYLSASSPSHACAIPNIASAYSLNITVVPSGSLGFLAVGPAPMTLPPTSSILNDSSGAVLANAAVVPAGTPSGSIDVYVSGTSEVIIDINGYYAPQTGLTIAKGTPSAPSISFSGDAGTGMYSSATGTLNFSTSGANRMTIGADGTTTVSGPYLKVAGAGNEGVYIGGDGFGNDVQLGSYNSTVTNVGLWNSATNKYMNLFVGVLTINGGSDLAEPFDVAASDEMEPEPGMVVSIDPDHPGHLRVADHAYDRTVAGIVSGAGGVKTGMVMSQRGSEADGSHPVALSGRVYCWADASQGPIRPGDLLTTSATRGHAMRADGADAQGAIIGKAMTSLEQGRGLVLVLVTLQ